MDVKLRQSIKKKAMEQSKFLDTIGTAHMSQEVEKKVLRIAKPSSGNSCRYSLQYLVASTLSILSSIGHCVR